MSAVQDGWSTSATTPRWTHHLRHQTITSAHTHTHTQSRALSGLKRPAKTWPSSYGHDHPRGRGWHLARCCACPCVLCAMRAHAPASLHGAGLLVCMYLSAGPLACMCVCVKCWHEEQCREEPGQHEKGQRAPRVWPSVRYWLSLRFLIWRCLGD